VVSWTAMHHEIITGGQLNKRRNGLLLWLVPCQLFSSTVPCCVWVGAWWWCNTDWCSNQDVGTTLTLRRYSRQMKVIPRPYPSRARFLGGEKFLTQVSGFSRSQPLFGGHAREKTKRFGDLTHTAHSTRRSHVWNHAKSNRTSKS
jgi:hypothetical protein